MSKQERRPIFFEWDTKADVATLSALVPVFLVSIYFGDVERGTTAACGIIVLVLLIRTFWSLRGRTWFWALIIALTMVHAAVVVFFPWTRSHFSALVLLPVVAVDFGINFILVKSFERWFE